MERVEREKRAVEDSLRGVMARTERVAASADRDAMVAEDRRTTPVRASDVRQYLAADALSRAVSGPGLMPFWKSAPYLAHFMHGYKFHDLLIEAIGAPGSPDRIVDALQRHDSAFLKAATLGSWGKHRPRAKLRELVGELIDEGLWRLLWMPPTLPYPDLCPGTRSDRSIAGHSGPKVRSILGLAARHSAEGRGRVRDRAGELRMDWTEPRGARSAMGIGWSGGRAGALCTGSSVEVAGRRRSVKTVPYVFPRPRSAVGDASRPTRGHQELRRAPGGRRWARHDESRVAGSVPAPTRRSTGYRYPS